MIPEGFQSGTGPGREEAEGEVALAEQIPKVAEPQKYIVILHNDDYTTMEFVVDVLKRFFKKSEEQANIVMLQVHREGRGVAGIFGREIAETKVVQVHEHAKLHGFPLRCSIEPVASTSKSK